MAEDLSGNDPRIKGVVDDIWAFESTYLSMEMPDGVMVPVPNIHRREPTREEIIAAITSAGYGQVAVSLTDAHLAEMESRRLQVEQTGGRVTGL